MLFACSIVIVGALFALLVLFEDALEDVSVGVAVSFVDPSSVVPVFVSPVVVGTCISVSSAVIPVASSPPVFAISELTSVGVSVPDCVVPVASLAVVGATYFAHPSELTAPIIFARSLSDSSGIIVLNTNHPTTRRRRNAAIIANAFFFAEL